MKKKLIGILAVAFALTLVLAGCGGYKQKAVAVPAGHENDVVESNGGLMVKKGDYYYYINGKTSTSDSNKWGNVIKGSLMRAKADEIADASKHVRIVPQLLLSANAEGGFSIYGNYIYYTSPYDKKGKDGNVQNTYMSFWRIKLDGTGAQRLATTQTASNSVPYRYFEKDGKVRLVFIDDSKIYMMDCDSAKSLKEVTKDYTGTPVLGADNAVYFTANVYYDKVTGKLVTSEEKQKREDDESDDAANVATRTYNKVMRYDVFEDKIAPVYEFIEKKDTEEGGAFAGKTADDKFYTVALVKVDSDYLYYTLTEVGAGASEKKLMRSEKGKGLVKGGNDVTLSTDTSLTGYLTGPEGEGMIYQDTSYVVWYLNRTKYIISPETGNTLFQIMQEGESYYLYMFNGEGALVKMLLPEASYVKSFTGPNAVENFVADWAKTDNEVIKIMKDHTREKAEPIDKMDTSWLKPEYIDGKWFFFNSASDAYDQNTAFQGKDDEESLKKYYENATMYYRNGYLFMYDTTLAEEQLIPVRVGELSKENAKNETESLEKENESRAKKLAEELRQLAANEVANK